MVNKGKQVKKLVLQNKWNLEEIAKMVDVTQEEVASLYKKYTGEELPPTFIIVGHDDTIESIKMAIDAHQPVLLHGDTGVGKTSVATYTIRQAGKVMRKINLSDKRTGTLLAQELYGSHKTYSDNVYLFDEVDNFHPLSHAYLKKVLQDSAVCIIMTCNDIKKVNKEVVKYVKEHGYIFHVLPPTRDDLLTFLERKFPSKIGMVDELYDTDFRIVMRRILYGFSEHVEEDPVITCEIAAGAVFGERNPVKRLRRIMKLKDPPLWMITWLDYNSIRFMRDMEFLSEFLDKVSIIDSWATLTNTQYLKAMIASLPCPGRKGKVDFPAALFNAERAPKKEEVKADVKETKMEIGKADGNRQDPSIFDPFAW